ncbi:MAG: HD-GYP domain-containing protein [Treponema sp.]|nr:HD-GYP domain-containing protein [Treponema sp.]
MIKDIPLGSFFTAPVYLDDNFILTAPEVAFSQELISTLKEWEFKEVLSRGEPREEYTETAETAVAAAAGQGKQAEKTFAGDGEQIREAEHFYTEFLKYTQNLFHQVLIKNEARFNLVAERVKELCDIPREKRRYLLRVMRSGLEEGENYLASHAVKSTIISIIIGSYIKLPSHRLIELGTAALLHEVGMVKLPPQVYLSPRALTPEERQQILNHPVLSYNLLRSFDFPLTISVAALEHHERENGSGYPRKLTGDKISLYAKIIAVACSYEALTGSRPHREAKDGYTGMLDLLKNEGKQYDDTIIKALVFSLSIYPIGLYVLLSNGKKGQVVDVNPEFPKFPMVQVLGELTPDGKNRIFQTSREGISIVRPLKKEETL